MKAAVFFTHESSDQLNNTRGCLCSSDFATCILSILDICNTGYMLIFI